MVKRRGGACVGNVTHVSLFNRLRNCDTRILAAQEHKTTATTTVPAQHHSAVLDIKFAFPDDLVSVKCKFIRSMRWWSSSADLCSDHSASLEFHRTLQCCVNLHLHVPFK